MRRPHWLRWPWVRVQDEDDVVPEYNDHVMLDIEDTFNKIEESQQLLSDFGLLLDGHCTKKHDYYHECDILCGPVAISNVLQSLTHEQLYALSLVAIKSWFHCYIKLRYWESQNS